MAPLPTDSVSPELAHRLELAERNLKLATLSQKRPSTEPLLDYTPCEMNCAISP